MAVLSINTLHTRIKPLNNRPSADGECVLYIMSRDQRVLDNYALAAAQKEANNLRLPLVVGFVLYRGTHTTRAYEHFEFMLKGLEQVHHKLQSLNIPFVIESGQPVSVIHTLVKQLKPAAVYFDFNPLNGPMKVQSKIAQNLEMPCYTVDTHNVVPVWVASDKKEFGARTLRPKIHKLLNDYILDDVTISAHKYKHTRPVPGPNFRKLTEVMKRYDKNGTDISRFQPGESSALAALEDFIDNRLKGYADNRNDPVMQGQSDLSPYIHFGQLGSITVVRKILEAATVQSSFQRDADVLIEELVVRKELSDNFCYYEQHYLELRSAPQWAQLTLDRHRSDERQFLYTFEELRDGKTHDPAWNAAQMELVQSGKMHGYMRMYWAKKVLEWSSSPQEAISILVRLNDFYSIDGGDPNGYVGILWSVAGVHDRPWGERPVYGTVRSMVYNGLKRKFDIEAYIKKWAIDYTR